MQNTQGIELFSSIEDFLKQRESETDLIPDSRKQELQQLADYVRNQIRESGVTHLTCICTHNSRRSHLSQIWAKVAADSVGLSGVQTFSGGTEATAMNPRVVDSLRRVGFTVSTENPNAENPKYEVHYASGATPLECFSKVYDQSPNPNRGYCAVMNCSSADQACPIVPGCDLRLPIRYDDPKISDDTPEEAATYDARSTQICREMLYAMQQVRIGNQS